MWAISTSWSRRRRSTSGATSTGRLVEELLEQAAGTLGEADVLVPGVGQVLERHADGDQPGVGAGVDVGRDLLEDDGGVAQAAPLRGRSSCGRWDHGPRYRAWGSSGGNSVGDEESGAVAGQVKASIWRVRGLPSRVPITISDQTHR